MPDHREKAGDGLRKSDGINPGFFFGFFFGLEKHSWSHMINAAGDQKDATFKRKLSQCHALCARTRLRCQTVSSFALVLSRFFQSLRKEHLKKNK